MRAPAYRPPVPRSLRALWLVLLPIILTGCFDRNRPRGTPTPAAPPSPRNAIAVLDSASLDVAARGGGMLTDVLRREIPALEVRRTGTPGSCPAFRIRGVKSIMLSSEPQVYVNGVRHVDTCILDAIPPSQILSVQVYGTGQSPPNIGMPSSPGGLIVIYLKN